MRNWRVVTAVSAVVLAALAAVLSYRYLTNADERAQKDVALVDALVAKGDIPRGATGQEAIDADLFETRKVPRNALPDTARSDTQGLEKLVAAAKVAKGQFIVGDSFVEPSRLEGFSSTIPKGKEAIAITVDTMRGVAGFIVPNDSVNVMVTAEVEDLAPTAVAGAAAVQTPTLSTTGFLIPGVKVLAVDTTTVTSPMKSTTQTTDANGGTTTSDVPAASSTITLEVTPRQALQITHAMQGQGQIYLSLNPPGYKAGDVTVPAEIVEAYNWFDQELKTLNEVRALIGSASGATP